jgi:hypothetical protein
MNNRWEIGTLARQGDVLIRRIDALPKKNAAVLANGVLAYGEVTGHLHQVDNLTRAEVLEIDNRLYLRVGEDGVRIVHDEHSPLTLPAGNYEVTIQREYVPGEIRNVAD